MWSEGIAINCQDRWRWGNNMRRRKYQILCYSFSVLGEHMSLWWNSHRARTLKLWRKAGQIQCEQTAVCQDWTENRRGNRAASVMS